MIIANTIATLIEWEGNAIGAVDWRPLSTIPRVIPILGLSSPIPCWLLSPLETAAGAIGATAPLAVIVAEGFVAAGAIFCRWCADVPTFRRETAASIFSLAVVRKE